MPSTELLSRLEPFGMRLDLAPFRALLAALDQPQLGASIVLVAGTNGKGSTAVQLAAMVAAAGYRVGLYTSPHLESAHERLRIDGVAIAESDLSTHLERVLEAAPTPPTYFEALTAVALLWFRDRRVDLAVLEVGLGGRLDATNATEPLLSVICEVALDHQEVLGHSLEAIAREKAGILRAGRPAVAWGAPPEVAAALTGVAGELGARLQLVPAGSDGRDVVGPAPWPGAHQLRNLRLARAAAERLRELGFDRLGPAAIGRGLATVRWPGRFELVPRDDGGEVVLDGAHNPAAVAALVELLEDQAEPYDLLFGALADKDVGGMLAALEGRGRRWVLTEPASPRALSVERLAGRLGRPAEARADLGEALALALESPDRSPRLVVTGSLYLVGEVRRRLRQRFGLPPPAAETRVFGPFG